MLKPAEISEQIARVVAGQLPMDEFERWFRRASRNFHAYTDEKAQLAIFEIESVLSEYHFASLDDAATAKELANAIRPFESHRPKLVVHVSPYLPSETVHCLDSFANGASDALTVTTVDGSVFQRLIQSEPVLACVQM